MKKLVLLMMVGVFVMWLSSCADGILSEEDVEVVSDEIVNTISTPVENFTSLGTGMDGTSFSSLAMVSTNIEITNSYGSDTNVYTVTITTNTENGYSVDGDWATATIEGNVKLADDGTEVAYGSINANAGAKLVIDGSVVTPPASASIEAFTNWNIPTMSDSMAVAVYATLSIEASGTSEYIAKPFNYDIKIGESKATPFTFSMSSGTASINGLMEFSGLPTKVSAITYNFDLSVSTPTAPDYKIVPTGSITGTATYNGEPVDYTLKFVTLSTVEITIGEVTKTKTITGFASMGQ